MSKRILAWALIPVVAVILIVMEVPVAFGKTVVLFSEFHGVLVDGGGKPQPGVRIERKWTWNGESSGDETTTAADGSFRFPDATSTSLMAAILPHEPVISQDVIAHGPDGPVTLWGATKHSYARNAELDGRPIDVKCRIDIEPNSDGPFWGTCVEVARKPD